MNLINPYEAEDDDDQDSNYHFSKYLGLHFPKRTQGEDFATLDQIETLEKVLQIPDGYDVSLLGKNQAEYIIRLADRVNKTVAITDYVPGG